MFKLSGVYAAMLTPFDANGKINEPVVREMIEFFVAKGIDGVFPISTVG